MAKLCPFIFKRNPPVFIVATGGTITTNGNYKIHTFLNNGTFEITSGNGTIYYAVVGGGGAGSGSSTTLAGGGGGAGEVIQGSEVVSIGTKSVVVGAGGTCADADLIGTNGSQSSIDAIVAIGGGYGGYFNGTTNNAGSGGSGGGATTSGATGDAIGGSATNGYKGGDVPDGLIYTAAGGGGAGSIGQDVADDVTGGNGGTGITISTNGMSITVAGGGGGASSDGFGDAGGTGGSGIGGNGGSYAYAVGGTDGATNTGSGGGGGFEDGAQTYPVGQGGSGVVVISYIYQ